MKILFVTHYADMYGANLSMCNLICEYKKHGIEADVICPGAGKLKDNLNRQGIKCFSIPYKNCGVPMGKKYLMNIVIVLLGFIKNRLYLDEINKFVDISQYDIIHTNSMCTHFGAMLAEKYNKPHVWHIREYMEEDYNLKVLRTLSVKHAYAYTDKFIAISQSIKDKFSKRFCEDRIELIYNGVQHNHIPHRETDKFVFVITGLISPNKGMLEAVEAFGKIARSCPDSELWVIGGGDFTKGYGKKLIMSAEKSGAAEKIKFLGQRMDVPELLSQAKCGLMCSKKEAFGRVTIEYMQNKLVTIGSNSGGTPELIEDGKTGFLYEPGNVEELAEKMKRVYENYNAMQPIIDVAYKRAVDYFSIERCANEIIEIYRKLARK